MQASQRSDVSLNKHQRKIDPGWAGGSAFIYDFTFASKGRQRSKTKKVRFSLNVRLLFCLLPFVTYHFIFQPMQTERRLNPA